MIRATIAICFAMLCAGLGDISMRKGMQLVGPLKSFRISLLLRFFLSAIANSYILLGVFLSTIAFFLWLVVLSWADVSWALPMNSVEYIFVAFLAMLFLKEKIDRFRWVGIIFISVGILFLMESW